PGVLHGCEGCAVRRGDVSDTALDRSGGEAGDRHEESPAGELSDIAESDSTPVEIGSEGEPRASPEEQQHNCLYDDAEGCRAAECCDHLRRPVVDCGLGLPEDRAECEEADDRDDVVDDRSPREGAKDAARVEGFAEQSVEPVEEDLRETPVCEGGSQCVLVC